MLASPQNTHTHLVPANIYPVSNRPPTAMNDGCGVLPRTTGHGLASLSCPLFRRPYRAFREHSADTIQWSRHGEVQKVKIRRPVELAGRILAAGPSGSLSATPAVEQRIRQEMRRAYLTPPKRAKPSSCRR